MFKRTKKGMCWVLIIAMLLMMLPNPTLALAEEAAVAQAIPGEIDRVDFNDDWQFYLATRNPSVVGGNNGPNFADNGLEDSGDYTTAEIVAPSFDDSSWRTLNVPHDWSIEGERVSSGSSSAQAYLQGGLGYYRKSFVLPASMQGQKHVSIDFEGVYQNSDVYVNGQLVGNYPSGYTGFTYDITEYLTFGDDKPNVIVVKVQNMSSSGRWYTGSGIVRPVTLVVTGKTRFVRNGVVITTPTVEQDYKANGTSYMTVKANAFSDDSNGVVAIKTTIYDASGAVVLTKTSDFIDSNPSTPIEISDEFVVPNVHLWSMEDPYRYTIQTDLLYERNGGDGTIETVDSTTNKFGFRWFRIDNDEGFFLNDKYAKFQGVDLHHDQGALGAAGTYDAFKRQMTILQTMGVNAYRSSHNPPSKAMIDVCSELGIVVMEEAYDGWGSAKATYDFGRFFMKDIPADWAGSLTPISEHTVWSDWVIKEMVARDINEPSIVMWSIGNEVRGVGTRPSWYNWTDYLKEGDIVPGNYTATSYNEYTETLRLRNAIKSVDTSRYVVIGGDQERSVPSNTSVWHYINYALDGYGLNYNTAESVDGLHAKYADTAFFFESESSSQTGARGVYFNPSMAQTGVNQTPGKRGTSAYDNNFASWTMPNEYGLKKDRDREFFLGQFIWSGFDYLGEPTPYNVYPVAISSFGCIDTAGFFKDSYYLYKSQWNNEPMAHIVPMNWNDWRIGEEVEVWVNTNAVKAELFLNGESLGTKSFDVKETTYGKTYLETTENTKDNRLNSTDTNTGGYVSPNGSHGKLHLTWMVPFAPGELKAVAMDAEGNVVATDIMKTADQAYTINMKPEKSVIQADGRSLVYIEADIVDENGVMLPSAGNLVKFDVEGGTIVGVDNGKQESTELYKWENVEKNSHSERSAYNGKVLVIVQSEKGNTGEISITASSENMVSSNVKVLATEDGTGDYTPVCVPAELGDVESIDTVNFALETGKAPVLPIDVKVNYESGFTQMKKVTWAGISNEKFAVPGSFEVLGVVDGIEGMNAKAMITVSAASEETIDIALNTEAGTQDTYSETGALATASFTNGTSYPNLMLNGNGSNSWTNKYSANQTVVLALVRNSHPYEFVEVYWPSAKTMGKIDLHFVVGGSNPSSNLPKSLNVQYWDGFEWKNATNQNVEWAEVSNEATNITFDRVMTSRIRVGMENETPYSATTGAMQISQFKVFDDVTDAEEVPLYKDPTASVEDRITDLLGRMTLEEKVGQMMQGEIGNGSGNVKPQDTIDYAIGSVLSGGGADPSTGNDMQSWYNTVTALVEASTQSRLGIPVIYGVDAVHGNSNVIGATVFPHNIGLGAIGMADLQDATSIVKRIGAATAEEMRVTNMPLNFAPCIADPQDPRWGRTYEGFGEDLNLVAKLGVAYVQGLQGDTIEELMNPNKAVATIKHFLGEGYTVNGVNQGNVTSMTKEEAAVKLLQPYKEAVDAGARAVMPSYNSIQGVKMHASKYLLTDILKEQLGFTGFVVSDYNAISQIRLDEEGNEVPNNLKAQLRIGINAGNDLLMQPSNWKTCITHVKALVEDEIAVPGTGITMERLDDAVSRILRVKFELGLFENPSTPNPAENPEQAAKFGSDENRALAKEAVSKSMVLLKNDAVNGEPILSQLKDMKNIFITGKSADDMGNQCGGWTIEWQGRSGAITEGTTILEGIQKALTPEQDITFSADGTGAEGKDVAIVVIGERPYAEGNGDNLNGLGFDAADRAVLANVKAAGIPTIVVLVSGRPMIVTDYINDWDGLVAAWLPGSEGDGVADVLFGDKDFVGKTPMKWSYYFDAYPLTENNSEYVMYDKGFGLTKNQLTPEMPEIPAHPYDVIPEDAVAVSIPGKIEAENFLHQSGWDPTSTSFIQDSPDEGGGKVIGSMAAGRYLKYYIDVAEAGIYKVDFRVSSTRVRNNGFTLRDAEGNDLCTVNVPNTGGYQNYTTISAEIELKAGKQLVTFVSNTSSFNFNWMNMTKQTVVIVESPKSIVEVDEVTTVVLKAKDAVDLYAFDLSFKYDTSIFELLEIDVNEDYTLGDVGIEEGEDGAIRLIGTLKGADEGINGDVDMVTLSFKAKDVHAIGSFKLALGSMLADRDGSLFNLREASREVVVAQADITGDGKVNISDLVLVAKAFGKEEGMQGYEARFDMNLDKVIDIQDLAYLALKIR